MLSSKCTSNVPCSFGSTSSDISRVASRVEAAAPRSLFKSWSSRHKMARKVTIRKTTTCLRASSVHQHTWVGPGWTSPASNWFNLSCSLRNSSCKTWSRPSLSSMAAEAKAFIACRGVAVVPTWLNYSALFLSDLRIAFSCRQ